MVCPSCGNPVEGTFCSRCGVQVQPAPPVYSAPPPMAYLPRVQQHLQTLSILWYVFGVYRAATGLIGAMFLFGMSRPGFLGNFGAPGDFPFGTHAAWMSGLAGFVAVISLVFAALSFTVGFALMNRKPWGRTLAIVVAILELIKIPFGTALGIYTLWVLAPSASGAEYDATADRT
jgi:hypothetical protein